MYKEKAIQHSCGLFVFEDKTPHGYFWLMMFYPKAQKPFCNYSFRSIEQRETYKQSQIKSYLELLEMKLKRKEARKVTPEKLASVPVGSIFNHSWGYDQTNQDYYQLVELRGHVGIFREIAQERYSTGWEQGTCKPVKDHFIGEPFRKKIQFLDNKPFISYPYGWCSLWDGREDHWTSYA